MGTGDTFDIPENRMNIKTFIIQYLFRSLGYWSSVDNERSREIL